MATRSRNADRLREELVILAAACPCTRSNPSSCPLHEVRKLEAGAIIDWLDRLSAEEKAYLAQYHECCMMLQLDRAGAGGRGPPADQGTT